VLWGYKGAISVNHLRHMVTLLANKTSTVKKYSKEENCSALGIQKTEIDQKG